MTKKRRTREQKIIATLRRQLSQRQIVNSSESKKPELTAVSDSTEINLPILSLKEHKKKELFSYNVNLIKKSLFKTLIICVIFFLLILFIPKFFRL